MALEPRLKQLLTRWAELRDAGQTPSPEDHCRDAPDLLEAFRVRLRQFDHLDERTHAGNDGHGAAAVSLGEATSKRVKFCVDGQPMRGGMGEVFPARDEELGRTVALKFIQRGKGGLDAERRFRREVVITARLQHPGIVPVFGPAVSEDGRSGYAMRFISGESFEAAIARHHDTTATDTSKPTRAELLNRFEAVCNTMAYAHSHGVIHRDLKPANVMLGRYGETFVVDWGLAKILADDPIEQAAHKELPPLTRQGDDSTGKSLTETGYAIGTIAYMPPEQAQGDHANLDERADVFALGAILCKILTGKPPYTGPLAAQLACNADVSACFQRLDICGAEADLIALARHCLQKSASDRPRNAQAVLDALRAHNTSVETQAREDRERLVAAEARSVEERRRRRVTLALAASVIIVLLVGGAGIWTWQEQRALRQAEKIFEARKNRENVEATLAGLDNLYERFQWTEAQQRLTDADKLVGPDGDADLRERIAEARRNTAFLDRIDEINLNKIPLVNGRLGEHSLSAKLQTLFAEQGFDVLHSDPAALATKLNTSPIRKYLLAALDHWAMSVERDASKVLAVTAIATGQACAGN